MNFIYMRFLLTSLSIFLFSQLSAQVIENAILDDYIRTVRLFPTTNEVAMPIIAFRSNEQLQFTFDDLSEDSKSYYYTLIHCNQNWESTDQDPYEYIEGFTNSTIDDYDYSYNTSTDYVHYRLQIPNQDMRITQSGNYALVVYEESPEKPVITKRFMVVEDVVEIDPEVKLPRTKYNYRDYQEIIFDVQHRGVTFNNPQQEVKASILQNQRWDNAHIGVQARFIRNNLLEFDNNGQVVFEAGNEYRRFDTRSLRFRGHGVSAIQYSDVHLLIEGDRSRNKYFIETDYNGQYYIDVIEYNNRNLEADYARVHFYFPAERAFMDKKLFVGGVFNHYDTSYENQLKWDPTVNMYETVIDLKQGFYDYLYYFVDEQGNKSVAQTEGNDYDAENEYTILIYYRAFGERYDRIIGHLTFNSRR